VAACGWHRCRVALTDVRQACVRRCRYHTDNSSERGAESTRRADRQTMVAALFSQCPADDFMHHQQACVAAYARSSKHQLLQAQWQLVHVVNDTPGWTGIFVILTTVHNLSVPFQLIGVPSSRVLGCTTACWRCGRCWCRLASLIVCVCVPVLGISAACPAGAFAGIWGLLGIHLNGTRL
jgi:hypothetical protein